MNATVDIAWAAGLLEGEGSFCIVRGRRSPTIAASMTDLDVLERLRGVLGGVVFPITKREAHWRDCWRWQVGDAVGVSRCARAVLPYLGERRRQQARLVLERADALIAEAESRRAAVTTKRKAMRRLRARGHRNCEIARALNVSQSYVSNVLLGRYDGRT